MSKSLTLQTSRCARYLIIDNASSDHSVDFEKIYLNVTLEHSDINLGFAAGNNRLLEECDTEFITLLNPDAFPEPDWLENLLKAAAVNPQVAAFGSRQLDY